MAWKYKKYCQEQRENMKGYIYEREIQDTQCENNISRRRKKKKKRCRLGNKQIMELSLSEL